MLGSKKKEEAFPVNEALLNVITPMGLEIKRNSLVIGENLGKVYGAVRYPQKVDMGWLSKITNIPSTIVSVGITPIDNGSLISAISKSIEVNQNRHLQLLLNIYEAAPDGEHYTIDGIDCYLTNEPDKAYQFIIYDCGVMQTPTSIFRDADHRLLCGSVLPYEIPVFHKALSECGSLEVRPVAICVPQEIQEYCMELFGENVQIAAASHDLFAKRVNGQIYRPLVEKYIAGEKRL